MHTMVALLRRALACVIAITLVFSARPALAQSSSDTGVISVTVIDSALRTMLGQARVTLLGPTVTSALTNKSGIVRYTDVPVGIYRVRVAKNGYNASTSTEFEVLGNREVTVEVSLGDTGPKFIGRVVAQPSIEVTSREVDANSAIRKISDSLTDALGKIAGVDITQDSNDPNAPQTVSLRGQDESQTAITLDGIPLAAPGAATNLRAINTDLFSGAGASFTPSAGSLAGSVNFRTLQPTKTWQERLAASYGTFDRANYQVGLTGSAGKLGIAALHTWRGSNSPLTFQNYTDASGLTYPHGGELTNVGDFLKLRFSPVNRTTLNLTALQNNQGSASLCTQDVTILPCGIGPGNTNQSKYQFAYATITQLLGEVPLNITGYTSSQQQFTNDINRTIANNQSGVAVASPYSSQQDTNSRGFAFSATGSRGKHTVTASGSTYDGTTTFTPTYLNASSAAFVRASAYASASSSYQLADSIQASDRLTLGVRASIASTSGSGSSALEGISAAWRPTSVDAYNASISVGASQPANGILRTLSDPLAARFDCAAGTSTVSGPGDQPSKQSAINYDVTWTHQVRTASFNLNLYRQMQAGQVIGAQVNATSEPAGFFPPGYFGTIGNLYDSPFVCGSGFSPGGVYVQQQIGNTTRVYQGLTASARIALGRNVVLLPNYTIQSATITAADARLLGSASTIVIGGQVPGRPVHRAGFTVDANLPRSGFELVGNAQYTGSNNAQHISPYVLVNAGVSHPAGAGRLTFFASNLLNTEAGTLSTLQFAQPIPLSGGGQLYLAGNPNAPRQYTATYSVTLGARPAAVASGTDQLIAQATQPAGGRNQTPPPPPPPGTDPLSLATTRASCPVDAQTTAARLFESFRSVVREAKLGAPLPDVANLNVTVHGDPKAGEDWYLELRPNLPAGFGRGTGAAGGGARGGAGGGPGPNAAAPAGGGPPGGFGGPPGTPRGPGEGGPIVVGPSTGGRQGGGTAAA